MPPLADAGSGLGHGDPFELEVEGRGRRLAAGDGIVIAPSERHDFEAPAGSRCLVLDTADPVWHGRPCSPVAAGAVDHLARFLAESLRLGLPVAQECGALLMAQAWGEAVGPARTGRDIDWAGLRRWVVARLAAPLTAADLAAQAGLGESQFRARCLAALGRTPMQWVRELRLARAAALRASGLGVAAVARRVGYDSPSALTAAMRRRPPPGGTRPDR